jgi:magnesium chelatase subunit I
MSITSYENLLSTAEYRCLQNNSTKTAIRFSDILGMIPSITGKVELVYEGEQEGANFVAEQLISAASKSLFDKYFPEIKKLKHKDEHDPYREIVQWFFDESPFEIMDDSSEEEYAVSLNSIKPLGKLIKKYMPDLPEKDILFVKEFVLWALVEYNKLNKQRVKKGFEFKDPYGAFLSDLK